MRFTLFPDRFASTKLDLDRSWDQIVARARAPKLYARKEDCPLIKLAVFGDQRTDSGSLRSDANIRTVTGVEGDYDAGEMEVQEAAALLGMAGARCLLYTTPSHSAERPRWRVLAPLSLSGPPESRRTHLARINGALGGILAPESFTLSQTYYWGAVQGALYSAHAIEGAPVDTLAGLDERAAFPAASPPAQARARLAEDGFISAGGRNAALYSTGCALRRSGASLSVITAALLAYNAEACRPPLTDREVQTIARSAADRPRGAIMEIGGAPLPDRFEPDPLQAVQAAPEPVPVQAAEPTDPFLRMQTNAAGDKAHASFPNAVLAAQYILDRHGNAVYRSRFDGNDYLVAAGSVRRLTDADDLSMWHRITALGRGLERVRLDMARATLDFLVNRNERDEIVEWLDRLRWDGVERLAALCEDAFGAERTELNAVALKNTLVACVARQYQPGVKFDCALVLCGAQGIGKTRALAALFGEDRVCSMPHDPTSKDAAMRTRGKLCVEMSELAALRRTDVEAIKDWISAQTDEFRAPYARRVERHPRRFVIAGSTNEHEFLEDGTGNRRFLPLDCTAVNLEYLVQKRDQIWAEAVALFRAGFAFWNVPLPEAQQAQNSRVNSDPWDGEVARYLLGRTEARAADILKAIVEDVAQHDPTKLKRVTRCLNRSGWVPARSPVWRDGIQVRIWKPAVAPSNVIQLVQPVENVQSVF